MRGIAAAAPSTALRSHITLDLQFDLAIAEAVPPRPSEPQSTMAIMSFLFLICAQYKCFVRTVNYTGR
jgi:hypothetical protein